MITSINSEVQRAISFLHKACVALGIYVHVFVMVKELNGPKAMSVGQWVGSPLPPDLISKSYYLAPLKAIDLAGQELEPGRLLVGRLTAMGFSGLRGGVRFASEELNLDITVGVGKLLDQHDLLLAATTLYFMINRVPILGFVASGESLYLHHAGFRFSTEAEYLLAALEESEGLQIPVLLRPAEDHIRGYVRNDQHNFYREFQFFPEGPHSPARHLDFVAEDPKHFLEFLASAYDTTPRLFGEEPNSPSGVFWVEGNQKQSTLGVMARSSWWNV